MANFTHLGQYWSARRRELRLLGAWDVRVEGRRTHGAAHDITDALPLPRTRKRFREASAGAPWDAVRWTYRSLPGPALELAEAAEAASAESVGAWALRSLDGSALRGERLDLALLDRAPDPEVDHLAAPILPRRAQAFGVTYLNSALERETEGSRG